jgi:hypothetical protein
MEWRTILVKIAANKFKFPEKGLRILDMGESKNRLKKNGTSQLCNETAREIKKSIVTIIILMNNVLL